MSEKPIKLTKSGKPDRRAETSRANISKAQVKVKEIIKNAQKKHEEDAFDFDSSSSESEYESEVLEEEPEIVKPKRKSKMQMIEEMNDKIEKLILSQSKGAQSLPLEPIHKEELKEEPKVVKPLVNEVVFSDKIRRIKW